MNILLRILLVCGLLMASGSCFADTRTGLIGYWRLDEQSGLVAYDSSGFGRNGSLNNFALSGASSNWLSGSSCKRNNCLDFDGTNDSVTVTASAIGSTAISVSAWVYVKSFSDTTFSAGSNPNGAVIFSTRDADADKSPTLLISPSGGSTTAIFTADSGGVAVGAKGATVISTGQWYHIVGTFNNDGTATYGGQWNVYVNGVRDNAAANNFNLAGSFAAPFTGSTWVLGDSPQWPSPSTDTSNIRLDDVRIYSRELSANDIAQLYSAGRFVFNKGKMGKIIMGF